ncbi:MAG: signal transduction histidine kinase [Myxococcota bacterium]
MTDEGLSPVRHHSLNQQARVLLIEDDPFDRDFIVGILGRDFAVTQADSGALGLEILKTSEFDVVLADHNLPGISGQEFLERCQTLAPMSSRVLLSGGLDLVTVLRSVNTGHIYAALEKPVMPPLLMTTIRNAAQASQLASERSSLIDELADANSQIYEEQQRLIEVNTELRTLLTIATHDLREPLRSTRFFLDKCIGELSRTESQPLVEHLQRVRRAHERMDELLHGLREWLHLQTGDVAVDNINAGVLIQEAVDNLARLCVDRDVELVVPTEWPDISANAPLLRSVFENLISNAVKFTPEERPHITLSWRRVLNDSMVRFEVADQGIGIDPAYHDQIFGMFKRLESRRLFDGTGAGLAICQKIVSRHKGRMGVDSDRREGAAFWFTIPAAMDGPERTEP